LSSGLLRSVRWFDTEGSRLSIDPVFRDKAVQEIDSPETSVSNHLTPRNNPEDKKISVIRGGSHRSAFTKVKVKFALQQAMKVQRGSRGIVLVFL
jgi:hypothetical protein